MVAGVLVARKVSSPALDVRPAARAGDLECTRIADHYPARIAGESRDPVSVTGVASGADHLRTGQRLHRVRAPSDRSEHAGQRAGSMAAAPTHVRLGPARQRLLAVRRRFRGLPPFRR
ncbi:hypothetical protein SBD_5845 [Streptomyces bottropensis ATCC 25435]|uniref:Uncharacterized protein n=1 Tax=Streptomyces bottropensis ATCC 25435 TaxID=1054862 RepID=M3FL22_9ACTN|nr:hypothetical protein SBD_5845 [Streptomyces bottropensis ATCC 25435]